MLSCLASLWMAAALGQAPDQSAWLKSVPAETAVVVRVKALTTVRDDLMKMLEAMSGNAAALARPQIEQALEMMKMQSGPRSVEHPFFMLMSLPKDGPMPGWAVMVESDNYEAVVKSISKKDDFKSSPKDGLDSFDGADGQPWFSAKGTGFVVFGPDQTLVKGTIKPSTALDGKIAAETKKEFLGGDLGIYVNVAAIQAQYGEKIDQAKQAFFGLLDQGGAQLDAKTMESAKVIYGAMFDSVKIGDTLALGLDFSAPGLGLSGLLTVKADSDAAKMLATSKTGSAAGLVKLPGEAFMYSYVNPSDALLKSMSKLGLSMMGGGGKPSADLEKAQQLSLEAGVAEMYQAMGSGAGGISGLATVAYGTPRDPAKAIESVTMMMKALKTPDGMLKDVVITPKAETYKGFVLNKAVVTYNFEKMAPANAPGGVESIKKLMGGDSMTTWYGTDNKTFFSAAAKTSEEAKAKIDAFLSGQGSLAKVSAYEAIRSKLPKDVSALVLLNVQGLVKFVAQTAGAVSGAAPAIPADMPKETALFGGSLTGSAKGLQFQFVVPANVGPVIEKGLVPVIQGLAGAIQ